MVSQLAAEPRRPYTCLAPSSWDKLIIINLPRSLEPRLTSMVEASPGDAGIHRVLDAGAKELVEKMVHAGNGSDAG